MKHLAVVVVAILSLISNLSVGETVTAEVAAAAPANDQKFLGMLDLRPSFIPIQSKFYTENSLEFGYQVSKDMKFRWVQAFNTNLYTSTESTSGLSPEILDGFATGSFARLYVDPTETFDISYTFRLYAPFQESSRNAGQITVWRNYFNFGVKLTPDIKVTLSELPILPVYSSRGYIGEKGPAANPVFENRVYLTTDFQLSNKLSLSVPVLFHQTRYANFQAGAANNASWGYFLWIWPELLYAFDSHYTAGLSYYSDNMVAPDLSRMDVAGGIEKGVVQLTFQVSI